VTGPAEHAAAAPSVGRGRRGAGRSRGGRDSRGSKRASSTAQSPAAKRRNVQSPAIDVVYTPILQGSIAAAMLSMWVGGLWGGRVWAGPWSVLPKDVDDADASGDGHDRGGGGGSSGPSSSRGGEEEGEEDDTPAAARGRDGTQARDLGIASLVRGTRWVSGEAGEPEVEVSSLTVDVLSALGLIRKWTPRKHKATRAWVEAIESEADIPPGSEAKETKPGGTSEATQRTTVERDKFGPEKADGIVPGGTSAATQGATVERDKLPDKADGMICH
jgi:hypothetical protein